MTISGEGEKLKQKEKYGKRNADLQLYFQKKEKKKLKQRGTHINIKKDAKSLTIEDTLDEKR